MTGHRLSSRDLSFVLHEWLQIGQLTQRPRYADHSVESFDEMLSLSERLATDHFAPHYRKNDTHEPRFDGVGVGVNSEVATAARAFAESGFLSATFDEALGGVQLPHTVMSACMAWFHAANISTTSYVELTRASANLLLTQGTEQQIQRWVPQMLDGSCLSTMCISESEAGSSVGDITTRARECPNGAFRLFGEKMWISAGDHDITNNIVHLVLARSPAGPPGPRGLSLFIVPKVLPDGQRNDVAVTGLNHKLGWRGTSNTALSFGSGNHLPSQQAGAIGYLIGGRNEGLAQMFRMMNEARISVGTGAAALGCAGYLYSLAYAKERRQGRPPSAKWQRETEQTPLVQHPDVRRMLLAQKAYAEGALAFNLYCSRLVDDGHTATQQRERDRALRMLDVLTPIAKSWPSQWCVEANSLAMQVLGGAGYTRDHDIELRFRDNRLNSIHEGTHGIHAIDLLGRKVGHNDGRGYREVLQTMRNTVERARHQVNTSTYAGTLSDAISQLDTTTLHLLETSDLDLRLANATLYLEAFGHVLHAWVWLELMLASAGKSGSFYDGKRLAGRYFFTYELPRVGHQFRLLSMLDTTTLTGHDSWF